MRIDIPIRSIGPLMTPKPIVNSATMPKMTRRAMLAGTLAGAIAPFLVAELAAQDIQGDVDLKSPPFTTAEIDRVAIERLLAGGRRLNLAGKSLNGLDLTGLDMSGADFRGARLNNTKFAGARLEGVLFDRAWAIAADFTGADLLLASLFAVQMPKTTFNDANLALCRMTGDFSGGRLQRAKLNRADLSVDASPKNPTPIRAILRACDLRGADFEAANLSGADLEFVQCASTNFMYANLSGADAGSADFRGAIIANTNLKDCDMSGARIYQQQLPLFAEAAHLDRAITQ